MERLQTYAQTHFNITLNDAQLAQFAIYRDALIEWNANRMNLTAITDPDEVLIRHFLDSLSIVSVMGFDDGDKLIDVGTGAGFPGLALAIAFPNLQVTLLESVNKKLTFIQHVIDEGKLQNATTYHARAEDAGRDKAHRGQYDIVTARAVARLPILLEYMLPLAKVNGFCIAMKGRTAEEELADSKRALYVLHGEAMPIATVQLPEVPHPHFIVTVQKTGKTPKTYPRKAGTPSKKPIGGGEK